MGSALSSDKQQILGRFGDDTGSSWSLAYNLYADRLLGTNLVPDSVGVMIEMIATFLDHF